jgi:hypothetical protein
LSGNARVSHCCQQWRHLAAAMTVRIQFLIVALDGIRPIPSIPGRPLLALVDCCKCRATIGGGGAQFAAEKCWARDL